MSDTIQILELFGGIGSPRCALRNLNIPTKAIDYVEINEKAVRSYNSMFREELAYKTQTVVGWNLKPDILIHGSPCQDMSIAGHQGKATGDGRINRGKGSDEGSGTRSSLMWETIHIIENMGEWRPRYVIWENVKNVKSKYMRPNFDRYMVEMEKLGYTNNYAVLDAREFGLPQARERVFTVSVLNGERFEFDDLIRTPMRNLQEFLEDDVPDIYDVTQPSVLACIGEKGIRRATVIKDCAYTITTRQDRTPAQVIDRGDGRYRYLTERECWRLMGYTDEDFDRAKAVQERNGKYYKALYDQAGNSIAEAKKQMEYGFEQCDILKISDNEIQFITGIEDYDQGVLYLQNKYEIPLILLTMGKKGSRAYYKDFRIEEKGFQVSTIETTGAGDTFCGCSLAYILEHDINNLTEDHLREMLIFANAGAALVTTKKGAICSMPERREIVDLIDVSRNAIHQF